MDTKNLLGGTFDSPPITYRTEPVHEHVIQERDVMVPMRDQVSLCIDIFRPDTSQKVPALLAIAAYNKDVLAPEVLEVLPPQPAWSTLWGGSLEAGDTDFLVSRGYAHVIGQARGSGKSESGGVPTWDYYDLIEWLAQQPWCDGNIGMIGISAYGAAQFQAAALQPPSLKAIFPYDPGPAYRDFRDRFPGSVVHSFPYMLEVGSVTHGSQGKPGPLSPEMEGHWKTAMANPDNRMYTQFYNILTMKGQKSKMLFNTLINPYDSEALIQQAETNFTKIKIPAYTGSGWYAYTYKSHLQGAQSWYRGLKSPKKLMFTGPTIMERPWRSFHDEIVKWYDHWLKGIDTGVMDEPHVKYWVMGENKWRVANDWPLPETQWTKYYLHSWERLRTEPFTRGGRDGYVEPDLFAQMPPSQTRKVERLRYMTEPLAEDTLVAGPISLYLHAAIDQPDTNWIVVLKDIGPDESARSGRAGDYDVSADLPERELTRGWLKASHRVLDEKRSRPEKPWHLMRRETQREVVPGEVNEYAIEIMSTANLFKQGHRICLEIMSMDFPTGVGGLTGAEYIPYHLCSSKTTVHKIYHNNQYPSHLLLPIIPLDPDRADKN